MTKKWEYTNALIQQVGMMKCTACGKPIVAAAKGQPVEAGDYRYRETDDAYLPQHRACSSSDPEWEANDKRRADYADFAARKEAAYEAFVAEFGEPCPDCGKNITDAAEPHALDCSERAAQAHS